MAGMNLNDPILTVYEVAKLARVHHCTIRKWINDKTLKAVKCGRRWYIRQSWFDELFEVPVDQFDVESENKQAAGKEY
jgi:excisionase family DNA binding protein